MRKLLQLVLALSLAGAVLGVGGNAQAGHCGRNMVIFSRHSATIGDQTVNGAGVNPNAAVCIADPDEEFADKAYLNPGATQVTARYFIVDWGTDVPGLTVILNGLGFDNFETVANRLTTATGSVVYDTPYHNIPGGSAATGSLTATFIEPDGNEESITFYTLGS